MGRRKAESKPEDDGAGSKRRRTSNRKKEMVKDSEAQSSGGTQAMVSRRKVASKSEGEGGGSKRRRTSNRKEEMVKDSEEKSSGGGNAAISESEPTSSGGVHPLLIDHILEKIFQYIIVPKIDVTLKEKGTAESPSSVDKIVQSLRLVCKQWKDIATRLYRRRRATMITFGNFDPLWKSPSSIRHIPDEKMQTFIDVMKSSDLIPIQRYKICPSIFIKENERLMKDLMRLCGPDATELNIHCSNSSTMRFSRRTFPDLNLAKMKKLKFVFTNSPRYSHMTSQIYELTYLLEMLLGAAETLGIFVLTFLDFWRQWKWSQVMAKRFEEIMSTRIPKTVQMLILDTPLSDLHLTSLAERGLKLKGFVCDWQCGVSSNVMRKFFETQAPTLKLLTMYNRLASKSSPVSFDFPRFDELCHLELVGGTIQPFTFQDNFPKLTTLDLSEWKGESTCVEFLRSAKKGLSLKDFHLPYAFPVAPLVKKAAQCFPNITRLFITPSPDMLETLQEVFVYFDNIEELYLSFPDSEINVDSLFSGVSEDDCQRIKDDLNFDNVDLRDVQSRPSVLNLTKLKRLALGVPDSGDVILTDFAMHFVFLKMASLKELLTKGFEMNAKCVDQLRGKLTLRVF